MGMTADIRVNVSAKKFKKQGKRDCVSTIDDEFSGRFG